MSQNRAPASFPCKGLYYLYKWLQLTKGYIRLSTLSLSNSSCSYNPSKFLFANVTVLKDDEENLEKINVIKSDEEDKRNEEKVKEKLQNFWNNIDSIIRSSTSGTKIKEVADLSLVVQDSVVPEGELQEMDQEKKVIDQISQSMPLNTTLNIVGAAIMGRS